MAARVLAGYAAGALLLLLVPLLVTVAASLAVGYVAWRYDAVWAVASVLVAGPGTVVLTCLLVLVVKRAVMPRAKAGVYAERSGFGVRKWIADGMMTMSLTVTHALYSTLYLVPFLRALGARTGRWSEVATVSFVDPDMLVIGPGSFVADVSVVGPAVFHRGGSRSPRRRSATAASSATGRWSRGLPTGRQQPARRALRRAAPGDRRGDHLARLARDLPAASRGQPGLPRQVHLQPHPRPDRGPAGHRVLPRDAARDDRRTRRAGRRLRPGAPGPGRAALAVLLLAPTLLLGSALAATLAAVVLKWLVIGRYRPRTEPLWSIWVRRTEVITGLYENLVVPRS
ncbi:hypothetical protein NKH77_26110 [Streptomyces sp. M19]